MSAAPRTLSELLDALSEEFAWRKKELSSLKTLVVSTQTPTKRDMCIRAAVPLLYAHWEGFIKNVGTLYVRFVSKQQLKHSELAQPFLAVVIGSMVQEAGQTSKIKPCLELVDFFRGDAKARSNLTWRSAVQTKSNLSSEVLREIVLSLGLDYSRFATKEKLLDEKLLANRNNIAHGKFLVITTDEYLSLHDDVLGIMQDFYNQVENASSAGDYRVSSTQPGQPGTT